MKARVIGCALAASLWLPGAALHASAPSELIERLFVAIGMDRQLIGGFEAMLPAMEHMASELELDDAGKAELREIYRSWFYNDIDRDAIRAQMITLYAETFSEQEVHEIIAFYQTPIGQKFLEVSPDLVKQGAQIGMQEGIDKQPLLLERLEPFIAEHRKR